MNRSLNEIKPNKNKYKSHLSFQGKSHIQKDVPSPNNLLRHAYEPKNQRLQELPLQDARIPPEQDSSKKITKKTFKKQN